MIDRERHENVFELNAALADSHGSQVPGEHSKTMQMDGRTRALLMSVRQALIMVLGALEDYLEMPRSIVPRRKR